MSGAEMAGGCLSYMEREAADQVSAPTDVAAQSSANAVADTVADYAAESRSEPASRRKEAARGRSRKTKRDQQGSYARRMVSTLARDTGAMRVLGELGVTAATISAVGAGLRDSYARSNGTSTSGVVVFPVTDKGGRTRYGCLTLPGFTINPEHAVGWSAGRARSVSYGRGGIAIVCASALEAWLASQAADAVGIGITAIASTRPDDAPAEWLTGHFWAGWERLLLSRGASRSLAEAVKGVAGRPVGLCDAAPTRTAGVAVEPHDLEDWMSGVVEGRPESVAFSPGLSLEPGDFAAVRMSVHGGLHDGRMYYAFAVERREGGRGGSPIVYSYRTLVIRSDGALLEPVVLPAPQGTPADRRVHALSDGTRIEPLCGVPDRPSWSLAGIERFSLRMREERPYDGPSGTELVATLVGHLRSTIWLPDPDDYDRVAAFVAATYFYRCFDAFPILYVGGPKGSGKSELITAIVATAFNGAIMAQGSGAALVRLSRDTGGLIAIDDAEALTAGFGELSQVLKTGYKARTAVKRLVGSGGSTTTIDFYGPRVLCNTRGLDEVLLSRCQTVRTEPLPEGQAMPPGSEFDPAEWRDMMHEYAMSHVSEMVAIAARSSCSGRADELALPLAAVAELIGD